MGLDRSKLGEKRLVALHCACAHHVLHAHPNNLLLPYLKLDKNLALFLKCYRAFASKLGDVRPMFIDAESAEALITAAAAASMDRPARSALRLMSDRHLRKLDEADAVLSYVSQYSSGAPPVCRIWLNALVRKTCDGR